MAQSRPGGSDFGSRPIVFEYQEYKSYVLAWVAARPDGTRGVKSRIAERIQCQLAYVSQIFAGSAHLSIEQAEALNGFLGHSDEEGEYFVLLVQSARAGTHSLREFFKKQVQRHLNQRLILKNRLTHKSSLNREDQATYYSHWLYCAVHMAVLIPQLRTPFAISNYFQVDLSKVSAVVTFLDSVGLVSQKGGGLLPGETRIHLESDSPMISKHHINWRLQAMKALERETPGELHYSGVIGISAENVFRVREVMVKAIEQVRSIVKGSEDEAIYCYSLDLFGLGKSS